MITLTDMLTIQQTCCVRFFFALALALLLAVSVRESYRTALAVEPPTAVMQKMMVCPVILADGPLASLAKVKFDSKILKSEHLCQDLPPVVDHVPHDIRINSSRRVTSSAVLALLRGQLCPRRSKQVQLLLQEAGVATVPRCSIQQPDTVCSGDSDILQGCSAAGHPSGTFVGKGVYRLL